MELREYVRKYVDQGPCKCGKCIDAPKNPEDKQPKADHTIDLTFFKVAKTGGTKKEFLELVKKEYPHWTDGEEHNYLQIGGEMGDQGLALATIGLGHLYGVWKALTPDTIMPFLSTELKMEMAGKGMVSLKA